MNKKVVNIVCIVLCVIAVLCIIFILVNTLISNNETVESEVQPQDNVVVEEEQNERQERGQNVNVNSRIGLQLKELITYSEVYSNSIINELDDYGLTNNAKLLIALDKISRKEEYQSFMQYSDEYNSTYILPENMNTVLASTFADTTITNREITDVLSYDTSTNAYIILPRGFANGVMEYTLEIPYKITEYSDRIELLAYRVYITKNVQMQDIETTVKNDLYYDKSKSVLIMSLTDESVFNDSTQNDYIKTQIDNGVIDTANLESVKYTFTKTDSQYRISNFENID